jgi:hypothetical protein
MANLKTLESRRAPRLGIQENGAGRAAVLEQMERILGDPLFMRSKRCLCLFRHVIEQTVEGRTEALKQRTLGVEVFGRNPNYDTKLDPVVRITAGEIRKRIAQYYHEPGHEHELRIELPSGSYLAQFYLPEERTVVLPEVLPPLPPALRSRTRPAYIFAAGLAIALAVAAAWFRQPSARERFWSPVWQSPGEVLILMGGSRSAFESTPQSTQMSISERTHTDQIAFSDSETLSRLSGLLQSSGKPFRVRRSSLATLADLRTGPVILIGGFNNEWTMRLTSHLRFTFERLPGEHVCWIQDNQNPSQRNWIIDGNQPYLKLAADYALISRVWDPTTERLVVIAAGIVTYGTIAAGEFLTDPAYMNEITKQAPRNWDKKNTQLVIETKVIDGNSGPPRVVAAHFW